MRIKVYCLIVLFLIGSTASAEEKEGAKVFLKIPKDAVYEKEEVKYLTSTDEKIAQAIHKAMRMAQLIDRSQMVIVPLSDIRLIIQYARYTYEDTDKKIPFIEYVRELAETNIANSSKWIKYYEAFN